jgi:hypothetical protein
MELVTLDAHRAAEAPVNQDYLIIRFTDVLSRGNLTSVSLTLPGA